MRVFGAGRRSLRTAKITVRNSHLLLPALLGVLVSCALAGADDLSEMGPRTNLQVTFWESGVAGEKEALSDLVFSFQRANPDVIVCLEWKDAQLQGDWVRRWCGGLRQYAPDVTVMSEGLAWEYRHELLDMPDGFGRELRSEFAPAVMRRLPGQARGVPWGGSTYALYYRPDLLAEAELAVPETMDDLVACADALADPPGRYGMGIPRPVAGCEELLHALALAIGRVVEDEDAVAGDGDAAGDGEVAADDETEPRRRDGEPDYAAALELLVDLQARGALQPEVLTWGQTELVELFAEGRLGMIIAPMSAAQMLRAADEPPEWAVAPLPVSDEGAGHLSVQWLVAFADTDRREAAMRLLRYMAEVESQRMLAMLPSVPAMREIADELRDRSPWSAHIAALGDSEDMRGAEGVPLSRWERLRTQLGEALVYALSGRMTPREALAQARSAED